MPQGLQVWDADGVLQLDTSTQTSTILTSIDAKTPNTTLTYTNAALSQGTPFYIVSPVSSPYASTDIEVSFNGNVASITTKRKPYDYGEWDFKVYIGVF